MVASAVEGAVISSKVRFDSTKLGTCVDKGQYLIIGYTCRHTLFNTLMDDGQIRKLPLQVTHPWRSQVPWAPLQGDLLKPGQVFTGELTVHQLFLVVWAPKVPSGPPLVRIL